MMLSRVEEELHVPTVLEFTPGFKEDRVVQYLFFCIKFSGLCLLSAVNPLVGVFFQWKWQHFASCKHRRC